jgi:hypothetical protein
VKKKARTDRELTFIYLQILDGHRIRIHRNFLIHFRGKPRPTPRPFDFAGYIELQLDVTITALDADWIAVLFDVPLGGEPHAITAGWLRASMRRVNEEKSEPGMPVLECREPIAVPPSQRVLYRIPIVTNARRIAANHKLRASRLLPPVLL